MKIPIVLALVLMGYAQPLHATSLGILFPGTTFTPGTPFTFSVEMPTVTDLSSYQIDIDIAGSTGAFGIDYFVSSVNLPAPANYVLARQDNVIADFNNGVGSGTSAPRLTLNDLAFDGTNLVEGNVITGANDRVADITVSTLASFAGDLEIGIDSSTLALLDADDIDVAEFASIQADTGLAAPLTLTNTSSTTAVPEPSSIALLALLGIGGVARMRRRRLQGSVG